MKSIKILICICMVLVRIGYAEYGVKITNEYSGKLFMLSGVHQTSGVEEIEYNVIKCSNIDFSNAVIRLKEDDFVETKFISTESRMDIVLTRGRDSYRMIFNEEDSNMLLIASPYENISTLKTYINKEGW